MTHHPVWTLLDDDDVELGIIPSFLDEDDPRSAAEQIAANYVGGWHPNKGFKLIGGMLHYPGDPPMSALAMAILHENEAIYYFPSSWVMVAQFSPEADITDYQVARLD